ncbi:MAG: hypothetical protein ACYDDF_09675 [Thermoplasmatota archaeon]
MPSSESFSLELRFNRPPDEVRAWWNDYPDDYVATDPTEVPFRIRTVARRGPERDVMTYWRAPDGSVREALETYRPLPNGGWCYDIARNAAGFRIVDLYEIEATPDGGSRLVIRSTVTAPTPELESHLAAQKERMIAAWKRTVALCERDAPRLPKSAVAGR